jgi:hypothetical protein
MLSIKGDTLFLSKGNFVILPIKGGSSAVNTDTFRVNAPSSGVIPMIQPTKRTSSIVPQSWIGQFFPATMTGRLYSISLKMANSNGSPFKVSFLEFGTGGSGITLATIQVTDGSKYVKNNLYSFRFEDYDIEIKSGNRYEFRIESNGATFDIGESFPPGWIISGPGYNVHPNYFDLIFAVHIKPIGSLAPGSSLEVESDGSVGIGTDNPSAKLEVKGRIKDQTGYVSPVGTIIAYGGSFGPEGWIECDGRDLKIADYPDLYAIIGQVWGADESKPGTFKAPDFRGRFLRGVDDRPRELNRDPDFESRQASAPGGSSGGRVGSVQEDDFKSHNHRPFDVPVLQNYWMNPVPDSGIIVPTRGSRSTVDNVGPTGSTGGKETRPKNAAVHYYIKY